MVKNLPANAGDAGSIPGLGRFSGVENCNPLQYSCLEKFHGQRSRWAAIHRVAKGQMSERLSMHACGWNNSKVN